MWTRWRATGRRIDGRAFAQPGVILSEVPQGTKSKDLEKLKTSDVESGVFFMGDPPTGSGYTRFDIGKPLFLRAIFRTQDGNLHLSYKTLYIFLNKMEPYHDI